MRYNTLPGHQYAHLQIQTRAYTDNDNIAMRSTSIPHAVICAIRSALLLLHGHRLPLARASAWGARGSRLLGGVRIHVERNARPTPAPRPAVDEVSFLLVPPLLRRCLRVAERRGESARRRAPGRVCSCDSIGLWERASVTDVGNHGWVNTYRRSVHSFDRRCGHCPVTFRQKAEGAKHLRGASPT